MQTVEQVKKRIDQLLDRDQVTDKELEEVYSQAVDTLRAIVSDVHNRYAVDGVVVPANLYGKVTVKDMLLLKQQYDKLPDDLSASEQDRVDYYTAMSQTSPKGLITALVGMALIAVVHKVGKIIDKNNQTAVKEEIAYQAKFEDIPKMSVKKYTSPKFKVKTGKDFIPWTERVLTDHDQAVNRISNVINGMVSQGMRAEDIANHFYPGNAESMRADNIPKIIRDATVRAKRTARTEAAAREDAIIEQTFKINNVKYFDWVTEPGACQKCTFLALSGPYKVGDEASPRVPESSHPNCRCRRKPIAKDDLDFMAEKKLFHAGKYNNQELRFKAKKVSGSKYDIWSQGDTKKYRDTIQTVMRILDGKDERIPRIVVVTSKKLPGIAAYDHTQDVLFISNKLGSPKEMDREFSTGYFAAKNVDDVLTHELAHKNHWDAAKRLYKSKPKRYNTVEGAKRFLDESLEQYVKNVQAQDRQYLNKIVSQNADRKFGEGSINEIVADVAVLGDELEDRVLLNLVGEVLKNGRKA
ncbi:MAG: hypothetical protein MRZ40_05770 [Ligilactobacillus animalis]|uniref:hypothetical protein n=1 Tax=Ligilactobacillus animalis TaxID=1605 RepID=UPI00242DC7F1|nr:hypothetical protein [Ligilactobacillus animalis]MCI5942062.1 hypothetical protein [Ligilactobacillus animalis]